METVQTNDVVFDIFKTLYVIENIKDIDDIFKDTINLPYNVLNTMAKQGTISKEHQETIREFFDSIISKNEEPLNLYLNLDNINVDEQSADVVEIPNKSNRKLPKHYGKKQIEKDIQANGGNKTELDRAMLALNELRNTYSVLKNRGISDKMLNTTKLNDEDCRNIVAAVRTLNNKIDYILNKK
jgi:hypothetical protein